MAHGPYHTSPKEFCTHSVQVIPITSQIIKDIMPYFPVKAKVIAGYLSEEQLYWKINYHWEYLFDMIAHCAALKITENQKNALLSINKVLLSNHPDPKTGYKNSTMPGVPKDKSSHETILARHGLVKQSKTDFKTLITTADLKSKSKRSADAFALAVAPVAPPNKGKHGTGYALDISGDNLEIIAAAKKLGATLCFDEGSHVHVEFAKGVDKAAEWGQDSRLMEQQGVKMKIDSRIKSQTLLVA